MIFSGRASSFQTDARRHRPGTWGCTHNESTTQSHFCSVKQGTCPQLLCPKLLWSAIWQLTNTYTVCREAGRCGQKRPPRRPSLGQGYCPREVECDGARASARAQAAPRRARQGADCWRAARACPPRFSLPCGATHAAGALLTHGVRALRARAARCGAEALRRPNGALQLDQKEGIFAAPKRGTAHACASVARHHSGGKLSLVSTFRQFIRRPRASRRRVPQGAAGVVFQTGALYARASLPSPLRCAGRTYNASAPQP